MSSYRLAPQLLHQEPPERSRAEEQTLSARSVDVLVLLVSPVASASQNAMELCPVVQPVPVSMALSVSMIPTQIIAGRVSIVKRLTA